MTDRTLVNGVNEWLIDQALGEPDIVEMFEGLCRRLNAIGIPVARSRLTWPTLHPLFRAETMLWARGKPTEFEQFRHQEIQSEAWLRSPMKHMYDNDLMMLRRKLQGSDKALDFPVVQELAEQGMTDYFVVRTSMSVTSEQSGKGRMGILVTWASDRPGGFGNDELEALQKIQRRFAVACKTAIQARIARNISETYLGREAGDRVLAGSIRRGDGQETRAVVWYNDLRNSTALADTMPARDYIQFLNLYFDITAALVIQAGGEVLDFIGDGVLAIFPYQDGAQQKAAIEAATRALSAVIEARDTLNEQRAANGLLPLRFGIGLNTGNVMFGNIGVPERLTFSVIGPTVNEVARIESLTKATGMDALVTHEIAALDPESWISIGMQRLDGVSEGMELFAPARQRLRLPPVPEDVKRQSASPN